MKVDSNVPLGSFVRNGYEYAQEHIEQDRSIDNCAIYHFSTSKIQPEGELKPISLRLRMFSVQNLSIKCPYYEVLLANV